MREATELQIARQNKRYAEVNLEENATYYVKDGELLMVKPPESGHGKQIITWQSGKPHMKFTIDSDFC